MAGSAGLESSNGIAAVSRLSMGSSSGSGSSSPLRHASSAADPRPARASPLRRDSACGLGSCSSSRRSSAGGAQL
jgi:hypothetical protein